MKTISLVLFFIVSGFAWAQNVNVDGIDANDTGDGTTTTIEIKKSKTAVAPAAATSNQWELAEGSADVEGEAGATQKDAKANWKKSCEDWKKEFKGDNKENKILSINCGAMDCGGEAGQKICTSKATYKIKTKVN